MIKISVKWKIWIGNGLFLFFIVLRLFFKGNFRKEVLERILGTGFG